MGTVLQQLRYSARPPFAFLFNPCKMRHLKFVLVLAIAANFWECGDAKFGENGELSPRRRRCYDGSLPKRLKKKERKLSLEGSGGGEVCHRLYPRVSCCPSRRAPYQILHRRDARVCSCSFVLAKSVRMHIFCYSKGLQLYIRKEGIRTTDDKHTDT